MLWGKSLRFAVPLIAACSLLCVCAAAAQSQDSQTQQTQSVADAARRAREEKKAAKHAKVITDDDLDKIPKPGAEGLDVGATPKLETQPPNPADVAAVEAADQAAASPAKTPGEDPEIVKLKDQ